MAHQREQGHQLVVPEMDEDVTFSTPLNRGTVIRKNSDIANASVIGGLREAHRAVEGNRVALYFGAHLKAKIGDLINAHKDWIPRVLDLLGRMTPTLRMSRTPSNVCAASSRRIPTARARNQ